MPKTLVLVLSTAFAVGTALPAQTGYAHQPAAAWAIAADAPDRHVVSVQYGPGSGTGTGGGYGGGTVVRCRIVRIPGSGMGPQRVCERIPRCRIVRIPGSGMGPQRVCD
jgi:hypothetical protein